MGKNAPMKGSAAIQPLKQYKQQGGNPMPKKPANQPGASMIKPPKKGK